MLNILVFCLCVCVFTPPFLLAPYRVPPIQNDVRFVLYSFFKNKSKPSSVTITASSPDGPLCVQLSVEDKFVSSGKMVHTLAARSLLKVCVSDRDSSLFSFSFILHFAID